MYSQASVVPAKRPFPPYSQCGAPWNISLLHSPSKNQPLRGQCSPNIKRCGVMTPKKTPLLTVYMVCLELYFFSSFLTRDIMQDKTSKNSEICYVQIPTSMQVLFSCKTTLQKLAKCLMFKSLIQYEVEFGIVLVFFFFVF